MSCPEFVLGPLYLLTPSTNFPISQLFQVYRDGRLGRAASERAEAQEKAASIHALLMRFHAVRGKPCGGQKLCWDRF